MRLLILGYIFFSATAAIACPDLDGKYLCAIDAKEEIGLVITQKYTNGSTIYKIDELELIADGLPHEAELSNEPRTQYSARYIASCEEDRALNLDFLVNFYEKDELRLIYSVQSLLTKTDKCLTESRRTSSKLPGGDSDSREESAVCVRLL